MNFDDHVPPSFHPSFPAREVGCQLHANSPSPVMVKEAKKLTIPQFDPAKLSWSSFAMKLHASLIKCDLGYLLREPSTNETNAVHSKELMLELFKKLQGSALNLFTGLTAQRYYLEGGGGIEMIKALVNKFHPMDERVIQNIISSMQSLTLADTEDLSIYRDKLENYNLQFSWVGQEMSPSVLVYLAQSQLCKSRYQKDIESLQMSHTASGTSFKSLNDLCNGLEWLDKLRRLPYGGLLLLLDLLLWVNLFNPALLRRRKLLLLVLYRRLKGILSTLIQVHYRCIRMHGLVRLTCLRIR